MNPEMNSFMPYGQLKAVSVAYKVFCLGITVQLLTVSSTVWYL